MFRTFLPLLACATAAAAAAAFDVQPAPERCGAAVAPIQRPPPAAGERIPDSQVVSGTRQIAWAWLGSPTNRYAHDALGSAVHAGSLDVVLMQPDGSPRTLSLQLLPHRVIEDRVPRLADLEGDGRDQVVVVESDARLGSSLVVYGLRMGAAARQPVLAQMARGPHMGSANRWLNPVGVADFDGDGRPDIAAVTTPHIGGVLTLYRYRPPLLEPAATMPGLSNHRIGTAEQQLSVIVHRPGQRPAVIIAGMDLRTLHALRIDASGNWKDQVAPVLLQAPVRRMTSLPSGACVLMTNGISVRVGLRD